VNATSLYFNEKFVCELTTFWDQRTGRNKEIEIVALRNHLVFLPVQRYGGERKVDEALQ
jgi:hypothetical protein